MFPSFVNYFRQRQEDEPWGTELDPEAEGVTVDIDREAAFRRLGMDPVPFLNEHDLKDYEGISAPEPDVFNSPVFQSTANRNLAEHLRDMPQRENPGFWKQLGIALTAGLAGAVEGPSRGLRFGQEITNRPYEQALDRWKLQTVPLEREAGREDRFNELISRNQDRAEYRDYLKQRDKEKFISGLSSQRSKQEDKLQARLEKDTDRAEDKAQREKERAEDKAQREKERKEDKEFTTTRDNTKITGKEGKLTEGQRKDIRRKAIAILRNTPKYRNITKESPAEERADYLLAVENMYEHLLKGKEK